MSPRETALALLADLGGRGIVVRATAGSVAVRPAGALTAADREAVRECRADLLDVLGRAGPWDGAAAVRLMAEADGLVERLGADGRHPFLIAAAERVVGAYATRNPEALVFTVRAFTERVRTAATGPRQKA